MGKILSPITIDVKSQDFFPNTIIQHFPALKVNLNQQELHVKDNVKLQE